MKSKLGIIFLHHTVDAIVRNNLRSVKKCNPEAVVATVSAAEALPGGYSLDGTPELKRLHSLTPTRGSDWLLCSWFLQRKEKCDKWWIVEWDTFCGISVREYYLPVWNFPFVTSSVRLPHREPQWAWFQEFSNLPLEYVPYIIGATPFLYLISEEALATTCKTLLKKPFTCGNGELRFATVANKCGFAPCGYSPPNDKITWIKWTSVPNLKAIFHPVKHFVKSKR